MADGKVTREALAEAVRELRAEVAALRAERAAHHCHCHGHGLCCSHAHCNWGHCECFTVHSYQPVPGCAPYQPPQVWYGPSGGGGGSGGPVYGYSVTDGVVTSGGYTVSASN